jgi:RNA polymerase subunit RPABC4/transcription elongation factor Spt4
MQLIKNTLYKTQTAQLTISPEFSYCNKCHHQMMGIRQTCDQCGSDDIDSISRIVGYFSVIKNWNKSKIEELNARHAGNYSVNKLHQPYAVNLIQGMQPSGTPVLEISTSTDRSTPQCDGDSCRL